MGEFEYRPPYKVAITSRISLDIINEPMPVFKFISKEQEKYFEKSYAVFTKYGVVIVYEIAWGINIKRKQIFSYFRTMVGDQCYSAFREDSRYSDIESNSLATRFIKQVFKNIKKRKRYQILNNK